MTFPAHLTRIGGLFGGKKRQQLDVENPQLRQWIARLDGLDTVQVAIETPGAAPRAGP